MRPHPLSTGTMVTTITIGDTPATQPVRPAGLSTGVIAAVVVVVMGVTISIVMAIAVATCVVVVKRRGRRVPKKTDEQILVEKEEVVSDMLKEAAKKDAEKKEAKKEAAKKEAAKKEAAKKKSIPKHLKLGAAKESRK